MKKIITAINNPKLNEELKKENNFEIIGKDIQYKEAILEILEKNNNIDLIIINEKIPGEINLEKLIKKIKLINEKIKIIFIFENENKELEKILIKNNIKDIYYNNKINLKELINLINKNEINIEEEIIKLKKIIEEKNIKIDIDENKINFKNNFSKKIKLFRKNIENKTKKLKNKFLNNSKKTDYINMRCKPINTKIITFSGNNKSGKSTLSLIFANYLIDENKRVLLIDMDLEKNDLSIILKKQKLIEKIKNKINNKKEFFNNYLNYEKNKNNYLINNKIKNELNKKIINNKINNYLKIKLNKNKYKKLINKKNNINYFKINYLINLFINKINKNFYFLSGINFIIKNKKYKTEKNNKYFFENFLKIIKNKKYDYILIDLSKSNNEKINREILKNSDYNLLVFEPNLLGIREIERLLEKYKKDWKIPRKSLHIVENKKKFNSISKELILKIFPYKNKIFIFKENKIYNILINNYYKNYYLLKYKNTKNNIYKIMKKLENI